MDEYDSLSSSWSEEKKLREELRPRLSFFFILCKTNLSGFYHTVGSFYLEVKYLNVLRGLKNAHLRVNFLARLTSAAQRRPSQKLLDVLIVPNFLVTLFLSSNCSATKTRNTEVRRLKVRVAESACFHHNTVKRPKCCAASS